MKRSVSEVLTSLFRRLGEGRSKSSVDTDTTGTDSWRSAHREQRSATLDSHKRVDLGSKHLPF